MMSKSSWRRLTAVSACALLAGCGWFGGSDAPIGKARPGADRQVAPTASLPAPPGHRLEQGVAPVDETRAAPPQLGSIVSAKGGQRAQKEAIEKEIADRDAREREARAKRRSSPAEATPVEPPAMDASPAPEAPPAPAPKS
jgi:hypothetical protein